MNSVHQNSVPISAPMVSSQPTLLDKSRDAIRARIYAFLLQKQLPASLADAVLKEKYKRVTMMVENKLMNSAKSLEEYTDLATLEDRVNSFLRQYTSQRRAAAAASATTLPPSCSLGIINGGAPLGIINGGAPLGIINGGTHQIITDTHARGVSAGFSIGFDQQRHQSAAPNNFNHQMVTCGISSPLIHGVGFSRNCVPLANGSPMASQELFTATHFSQPFLQPSVQSHMPRYSSIMNNVVSFGPTTPYGVVMSPSSMTVSQSSVPLNPNPMVGVDATVTSYQSNMNLQGMQQTPLLWNNGFLSAPSNNEYLAHASQQHIHGFHHQARNMEHQGQHFQKQDRLLHNEAYLTRQSMGLAAPVIHGPSLDSYNDAYLTRQSMGLAAPVMHGPSLDSYKEALERQATTKNGFRPSKLQCQPKPDVKDHYIGGQSASVHTSQMNSSPSFQPHPHQNQLASVLVQRQPSLQNSTGIPENNNGDREHIAPMQPGPANRSSSAIPPISSQIVSPRGGTAERETFRNENDTSSEQVNGNSCQTSTTTKRWLLLMIHARHCKARKDQCASKYCFEAREILRHINCCKVPDCTYRYCLVTRKWFQHYKQCDKKVCDVCVFVKNYKENNKEESLLPRRAKSSSSGSKSSKSSQPLTKRGSEAPYVDDDVQPLTKRLKLQRPSQNPTPDTKSVPVTGHGIVCKPHSLVDMQEKNKDKKSVKNEVMPMDIDVPHASANPVTRELEKHVSEEITKGKIGTNDFTKVDKTCCLFAQGKCKCMDETKKENVTQSVDVVDASKMEISSLVELFTPEQVKEHLHSLRQWVGQSKTKAEKNKAMESSMSVNSCQLCAVERLVFEPIPIYCSPCGIRIKKNALHYSVAVGKSRHCVCAPCYSVARENLVSIDGTCISKSKLEKKKNDEQVGEGWVQCDKCEAWQHQICALFNSRRNHGEDTKYTCPNCYIQEVEQGERRPLPSSAILGAKSLPVTALSNHIEERLFKNLKKERQKRARLQGKSYEEVPGAESLTVRVVASVDKVLEVKKSFREIFQEENYPSEFPYKSKAILLFQKIENVEVCLFSMFVQEYGTEAGPPNQRRVYLSYLDSVKYFRPEVRTVSGEALRTFVYHEILIGYLDYCKKRGFTSCYIWACPPLKGDDYILYCHPEIQKTPKTDKLREWYIAMLKKASKEDVVVECTNLYEQFFVQSNECRADVTAARLPYFDGDYWPGAAEDFIRQMMSQEDDGKNSNRKGLTKKVISKRSLRGLCQLDLSDNASKDRLMMQKLGETICPMKEDFIMVHLQHCCKHCSTLMISGNRWVCNQCKNFQICDKCHEVEQNRIETEKHPTNQKEKHLLFPVAIKDVPTKIEDKDDNLESEFFDNRQAFLSLCQGNNYQYDTLRRAKHSSMMILYHLHNPTAPAFATMCTICQQEVEHSQGWHCEVCPGYDVCNACHPKASINHPHNLISRSSSTGTGVQQNGQTNRNYQIQFEKIKELLVHVAECRSAQCQYQGCRKTKEIIQHCLECKTGHGTCPHCKKLWSLLRFHARSCKDSQCTALKCRDLRAISSRQQQQSDKRRRAAVMEMMRERAAEATST